MKYYKLRLENVIDVLDVGLIDSYDAGDMDGFRCWSTWLKVYSLDSLILWGVDYNKW